MIIRALDHSPIRLATDRAVVKKLLALLPVRASERLLGYGLQTPQGKGSIFFIFLHVTVAAGLFVQHLRMGFTGALHPVLRSGGAVGKIEDGGKFTSAALSLYRF